MRYVNALTGGVLIGLVGGWLLVDVLGVSQATAAIAVALTIAAVLGVIVIRRKQKGTASLHYTLMTDRFKQGLAYLDAGQFRRAMAFFGQAVEIEPDNADAYFGRGLVHHEMEQYQQAIADFDRAIEIAPCHPYAHFQRGFVYHQLEQYEQAVADFSRGIEIRPDEWAYLLRAVAYSCLGQAELARADRARAAQLVPRAEIVCHEKGTAQRGSVEADLKRDKAGKERGER